MLLRREIQQVTYSWGTGWVNVHVHEEDDAGNTWGKDYAFNDVVLQARAERAGRTAWDDSDIAAELNARYPLG